MTVEINESKRQGALFVVSAPSGAGKTSLCRELIDSVPGLRQSVSFATREVRSGERDGVDYHFVKEDVFRSMIAQQQFAEWAEVHGNLYGTAVETLDSAAGQGIDLLLDIDFQGAAQLKDNCQHGVFIFILPPDMIELEKRLRSRQTNNEVDIQRRMGNAEAEIAQASWYDYLVVNDDFATASQTLAAIITAERNKAVRNQFLLDRF